ncbi:MAG: helix-turn-helix transcriptional regulator [Pseudomonadales bacterium]
MGATGQDFSSVCRSWRQFRRLSQLELALAANVSQRHVSWLETGKSQPSREMVVRLSEALDVPLRERNVMLQAAGYAGTFRERELSEPAMEPAMNVLKTMLDHHDPLPAFVIDPCWNVKMQNAAADRMLKFGTDAQLWTLDDDNSVRNVAWLTLHPQGLRPHITNWSQIAPDFARRLRRQAMASVDPEVQEALQQLIALAGPEEEFALDQSELHPALPMDIKVGDIELSFFTVVSAFDSPLDVTLDELRIESLYPTNEQTRAFFHALAA